MFAAGGLVFFSGAAILLPGVSASQVESIQQLLSLALFPAVAFTAIQTLRAGFRPAVYSTLGILFFLAFGAGHVAHSRHWLPDGFFSGRFLVIGFLGDFVWFVLSLTARAAVLGREDPAASETENIRTYQAEFARKKYERSKLGAIDTTGLAERLRACMEVDRCYCDEDLTLDQLAAMCAVTRHELSEFLNDRLGINFNRYINDYRVREVRERLVNEPDRTILDIAFSSGFNSKTRFNTEFKRVTTQTPSEFRQSALRALSG